MSENTNSISTPNIRKYKNKHLGVNVRRIGTNRSTNFKTPLSESKVSSIIAAAVTKTESPKTPLTGTNLTHSAQNEESKSTGCLPIYKLSMNKKFRGHYKKKKLQFDGSETDNDPSTNSVLPYEDKDLQIGTTLTNNVIEPESCKGNIKISHQEHEKKIAELKNTIEIWKIAFKNSLDDLSNKLNEDKEIILQKLQISQDMIKLA